MYISNNNILKIAQMFLIYSTVVLSEKVCHGHGDAMVPLSFFTILNCLPLLFLNIILSISNTYLMVNIFPCLNLIITFLYIIFFTYVIIFGAYYFLLVKLKMHRSLFLSTYTNCMIKYCSFIDSFPSIAQSHVTYYAGKQ